METERLPLRRPQPLYIRHWLVPRQVPAWPALAHSSSRLQPSSACRSVRRCAGRRNSFRPCAPAGCWPACTGPGSSSHSADRACCRRQHHSGRVGMRPVAADLEGLNLGRSPLQNHPALCRHPGPTRVMVGHRTYAEPYPWPFVASSGWPGFVAPACSGIARSIHATAQCYSQSARRGLQCPAC
ncbi:hypothetical protein D3C77_168590 [compost metagenome]